MDDSELNILGSLQLFRANIAKALLQISNNDLDKSMQQIQGVYPNISCNDLLNLIDITINRIENIENNLDDSFLNQINYIIVIINDTYKRIIDSFNSRNVNFYTQLTNLLSLINIVFQHYFDFENQEDLNKLPKALKRRINYVSDSLNEVEEKTKPVKEQIKVINEAYATAESLPTTMASLKEYENNLKNIKVETDDLLKQINENEKKTSDKIDDITLKSKTINNICEDNTKKLENYYNDIKSKSDSIIEKSESILKQMKDKLTTSTGIGLAHAFSNRSKELKNSSWWWTLGFAIALLAAVGIAYYRFLYLKEIIQPNSPVMFVLTQLFISIISMLPPVWFAVVSSKQIQKLFKLSEDYAYKASISASYEGYKNEAFETDEKLVFKLLNTALTKIDEEPLRLTGKEQSHIPFNELMGNPIIQKLMEIYPDLQEKLLTIAYNMKPIKKVKSTVSKKEDLPNVEQEKHLDE